MMKKYYIIIFCFAVLRSIAQPSVNDTVPDFSVVDVNGEAHHLYSYLEEGKYVCIDFFGTTCDQCQDLVPVLSDVYKAYGCNQSQLILLAIDLLHYDAQVLEFEEEYGGIYPAVSGKNGGGEQVYNDWQIGYWPQLVLINPDKILVSNMNPIQREVIDSVFLHHDILMDSCLVNGFLDQRLIENITIFPNPTDGLLNVDICGIPKSNIDYRLYNSLGTLLWLKRKDSDSPLDLSGFNSGIYILEIEYEEAFIRKKILIN